MNYDQWESTTPLPKTVAGPPLAPTTIRDAEMATLAAISARLDDVEKAQSRRNAAVEERLRSLDEDLNIDLAIFAAVGERLDALEAAKQPDPWPTIEALITRIEELEEARIDSQEAPEGVANVSEVSQEPGNATEAHSGACATLAGDIWDGPCDCGAAEVAAALRVYRKVQACSAGADGYVWCFPGDGFNERAGTYSSARLLAWLKEGEA